MLSPFSGWPELAAGHARRHSLSPPTFSHRPWPPLATSAAGQDEDRARPPPARTAPASPPAAVKDLTARTVEDHRRPRPSPPAAVPRNSRVSPAPARPLCSELVGARTGSRAPCRSSPRPEPAPGRSSPCLPLYEAPLSCPCPKLAGATPATDRNSSCPPLARARRRREVEERSMAERRGGARPWVGRGTGGDGRRGSRGARRQGPAS
jgi:hypothetical protein